MQWRLLCCVYAGSSLEVKIETDSNDAVEINTEADSNDITETVYPLHDKPSTGMFGFFLIPYCQHLLSSCQACLDFAFFNYFCSFLYTNTVIRTVTQYFFINPMCSFFIKAIITS